LAIETSPEELRLLWQERELRLRLFQRWALHLEEESGCF
jgi:hypothetical protein